MNLSLSASKDKGDSKGLDGNGFFNRIRSGVVNTAARPYPGKASKVKTEVEDRKPGSVGGEEDAGTDNPVKKSLRDIQFQQLIDQENVDLAKLRKLSWNGIPKKYRPVVWQMLLGYIPTNKSRRIAAIDRKRKEYHGYVEVYYNVPESFRSAQESETIVQILKDLHRCRPDSPFFQQEQIQRAMERILYLWSIRHPASGYVQGTMPFSFSYKLDCNVQYLS